jgi:hypothetical protein
LDYQAIPVLLQVLAGNFLLLFLYVGCITNQGSIPFGCLLQLLVRLHQGPLLCFLGDSLVYTWDAEGSGDTGSGVFIAEEFKGVGDEIRRYHNGQCRETLGGLLADLPDLGLFSATAEVSGFTEYQHLD